MASDIIAFAYFSGLFVAGKRSNWRAIETVLWSHFIIVFVLCACSIIAFNGPLLYDKVIYSPVYHFWGLLYGWIYFLRGSGTINADTTYVDLANDVIYTGYYKVTHKISELPFEG